MVIVIEDFKLNDVVVIEADLLVMEMKIQVSFRTSLVELASVKLVEECWSFALLCSQLLEIVTFNYSRFSEVMAFLVELVEEV